MRKPALSHVSPCKQWMDLLAVSHGGECYTLTLLVEARNFWLADHARSKGIARAFLIT